MGMQTQILVRNKCTYYACDDGIDKVESAKTKGRKIRCEICYGKGYIEEWVSLEEVLRGTPLEFLCD